MHGAKEQAAIAVLKDLSSESRRCDRFNRYVRGSKDRWIDLYVGADGSVRLSGYELGPSVKEWSDDDYEYHVNVSAAAVPKLVFALLREKYLGRRGAVQEFREFCEKEGIELWW